MYLTHMPLNADRRSTRALVASPQRMHAAVLGGYTPGSIDAGRVLWRLDRPHRHQLDLYVVSPIEPSFDALVEQAGWTSRPVWRSTDYQGFLGRLASGQEWRFQLRANPIKSVKAMPGTRGKRMPLTKPADQLVWLTSRAARWGFEIASQTDGVPNAIVSGKQHESFSRGGPANPHSVTIAAADYQGVLRVTEPDALRKALVGGIGPAKGYGCGLMTLARPQG